MTTLRSRVLEELESSPHTKTLRMQQIELEHGVDIVVLIRPHPGIRAKDVAASLGIKLSTLVAWRQHFGFKETRMVKPGPKRKRKVA